MLRPSAAPPLGPSILYFLSRVWLIFFVYIYDSRVWLIFLCMALVSLTHWVCALSLRRVHRVHIVHISNTSCNGRRIWHYLSSGDLLPQALFLLPQALFWAAAGAFLCQSVWRKVSGFTFWWFHVKGHVESSGIPVSKLKLVVWGASYGHFKSAKEFLAECAIYSVTLPKMWFRQYFLFLKFTYSKQIGNSFGRGQQ